MKATVGVLLALLMLASPLAVLASAQEDEATIERDLQVEVTTGSTDRFGGGDWIRIDVGSTTFAVLYGNESNPNTPKMVVEYTRYLGAFEVYNETGVLVHGLTPLPVRTLMVQRYDRMVEFNDTDNDKLMGSDDLRRKILFLRQAWELEGLVINEGERLTTVDFNVTATNLQYDFVDTIDVAGDRLDRITLSFHVAVELLDTTLQVPVYSFTVNAERQIVGLEKRTQTVSGITVDGSFKYDHYIEGWDGADDSRLALVTHVFAGNFIPEAVMRFVHLEYALRALEGDTPHTENTIGDWPLLITADSLEFEDEWERVGRLRWVSDVVVDGQDERMLFQLHLAKRFDRVGLHGAFMGVLFGGAFVYPWGNVIFHDPGLDASVFVPEGQLVTPGGVLLGLAPYLIQLGVVGLAIVGLVAFRAMRKKTPA